MKTLLITASSLVLLLIGVQGRAAESAATSAELDAFWAEISRTVAAGDFEGYAATYHRDAILVSVANETSYPIALALTGWQQGFEDTKNGKVVANVEFRFTQRLNDETTAHETGIFHYMAKPDEGEATDQYLHFEALLVKTSSWKMMMEYQKVPATKEEWAAAD